MLRFLAAFVLIYSMSGATFDFAKQTLDVGLTVGDVAKSRAFYGEALGLKFIGELSLPNGGTMFRYQHGTAVIKLSHYDNLPPKVAGQITDVVGLRLMTFVINDIDRVLSAVKAQKLSEPKVYGEDKAKIAFVADPDGNIIELLNVESAPEEARDRMQLGFTVSDSEKTREFYTKVLGFTELPSKKEPLLQGATKYSFVGGNTLIKFWAGDKTAKTDTGKPSSAIGLRYITVVVKDVDEAEKILDQRGATIVIPPADFGRTARIMFITDPDGNWIEFASRR